MCEAGDVGDGVADTENIQDWWLKVKRPSTCLQALQEQGYVVAFVRNWREVRHATEELVSTQYVKASGRKYSMSRPEMEALAVYSRRYVCADVLSVRCV